MEGSKYDRQTYRSQSSPAIVRAMIKYSSKPIRYPGMQLTKSYAYFWLATVFNHLPFGLLIDTILRLRGKKPR